MVIKVAMPGKFQFRMVPAFQTVLFQKENEIHYIGGSEVLPPPLLPDEEASAIERLGKTGSEEAKSLLIEHNLRLVVYIAEKIRQYGSGCGGSDFHRDDRLIKPSIPLWPEKKIKLATYASAASRMRSSCTFGGTARPGMEVSIDEPLNVDWDGNELLLSDILGTDEDVIYKDMETEAEYRLLNRAIRKLSKREQTIVSLRFGINSLDGEEKTQKEVANILGISQSYISRLEKKIMKRLRKEMVRFS